MFQGGGGGGKPRPRKVDFVLSKGNKIISIEVKSGKNYKPISGTVVFEKMYNA